MPTKKQLRAAQRRRYEAYEAKLAARAAKRRRARVVVTIVAVAAVAAGGVAWGVLAGRDNAAGPTPSPSVATPEPSPSAEVLQDPSYAEDRTWAASVDTNVGVIELELDGHAAPQAVASFVYLAQQGYFNGTSCHRLTTQGIFVLQCGDPTATGSGGPGYSFGPIENAPGDDAYPAGTLAMARRSNDAASMGSQFFLVYQDSTIPSDTAGGYTVFGRVTAGLDILLGIAQQGVANGATDGPPAEGVVINEITVS